MTEPLVFLTGLMCDARVFSAQFLDLSSDRAVTVAPTSMGERVEQIASDLLDQLPHRFALAGHSMGAIIAMEIYRRAPDRVARLCLISTDSFADTPQIAAAREPLIVGARSGRLDVVMREALPPEVLAEGPIRAEIYEFIQAMSARQGPEVFVRQMRALQRRPDQQATLRKISVPTLVLCGAQDTLTPVKRHVFMSELIPTATLRILEDAGHFPMLETPTLTTEALREWLALPHNPA
ncbi:alpha/beta hydrolase [Ruegeria sp. 2205SS24-7]|uniref:alpha/beta fold hydrolase n=1 Tax=Ruegeria discodermiae TaxID=3064389 RepID=UPI002741605C|nr:alpha/beta hydrolase [Ruegeria sp. 2205SS24-7]MDP5216839.1 alpha/beta hydrolase [Ruegeria sp. 2205SS24-7]